MIEFASSILAVLIARISASVNFFLISLVICLITPVSVITLSSINSAGSDELTFTTFA